MFVQVTYQYDEAAAELVEYTPIHFITWVRNHKKNLSCKIETMLQRHKKKLN